ncbi:hypothetical protein ILUMI_05502, partial [Ignelater luminosus]
SRKHHVYPYDDFFKKVLVEATGSLSGRHKPTMEFGGCSGSLKDKRPIRRVQLLTLR